MKHLGANAASKKLIKSIFSGEKFIGIPQFFGSSKEELYAFIRDSQIYFEAQIRPWATKKERDAVLKGFTQKQSWNVKIIFQKYLILTELIATERY